MTERLFLVEMRDAFTRLSSFAERYDRQCHRFAVDRARRSEHGFLLAVAEDTGVYAQPASQRKHDGTLAHAKLGPGRTVDGDPDRGIRGDGEAKLGAHHVAGSQVPPSSTDLLGSEVDMCHGLLPVLEHEWPPSAAFQLVQPRLQGQLPRT